MKIAVAVFRAWSAARRYKSLLINAKALGHQAICIGSRWPQGDELTKEVLAEIGVPFHPLSELAQTIERFGPDILFGEAITDPFEDQLHAWAKEHKIVDLALDHAQLMPTRHANTWDRIKDKYPRITLMVANEEQKLRCLQEGMRATAMGLPDLDLIQDHYDVQEIRNRLGVESGQVLIGFFLRCFHPTERFLQSAEWEALAKFFQLADQESWKVVMHCHPALRFKKNSRGPEGLQWPDTHYVYLRWMQDHDAHFIAGFGPGKIGELEFHLCDSYELMAAADCLMGTEPNVAWAAFVMGKKYIYFQPSRAAQRYPFQHHAPNGKPWPNIVMETPIFENVHRIAREHSGSFEDNPLAREEWFYKLDRNCWKRMLNLAEELYAKT